ncbi:MAG TPA: hypothetical protein O0X39_04675 [Methanocorpusculum sp.]|nr:hypothetical protein [Methanocorpusculum sp.]
MDKKDSGVSVVIIFIMVLAVLAVVVAVWALLGVPGQINEMNYQHSYKVENKFGDYQAVLHSIYLSDYNTKRKEGYTRPGSVTYSNIIPVGRPGQTATLELKQDVARFYGTDGDIKTYTVIGTDAKKIRIDRLSVQSAHDCEIGLEGGGVFRRDRDSAFWIIRPLISSYETDSTYNDIIMSQYDDLCSVCVTTNGDVSLSTWYEDEYDQLWYGLTFYSPEKWEAELWYDYFYEMQQVNLVLNEQGLKGPLSIISLGTITEVPGGPGSFYRDAEVTGGWYFDFFIDDSITSPLYGVKQTQSSLS